MLNLTPSTDAFGLPQLNVAGLTTIGSNSFQPSGPRENFYSLANDLSWVRGKHSMKFGFDGRYYRPAALVQQTPNSILTFENRFTNQPGVARSGNAVADLVLGQPYTGRATLFAESNGWVTLKYYYTGFYVQDEIRKQFPENCFGAMISFELKDAGQPEVFRFMDKLKLVVRATSLGDVHTMVLYPTMASHRDVSPKQRQRMGIGDNLLRLSVGIESTDDIIADLAQAIG